ncbi:MAG: aminotransferase class V-fold PLP-dependent enzyme, partial [Clostridia bacterium]|nr:aminotransferase class V-fold PLP-dependent enzyme [Clostridia bacterium]
HKALLGPQGTGGLYLAPGLRLETLREGGTGSSSELLVQPEELPERYEAGTLNLPGIEGLGAGAQYVRENAAAITERVHLLSQALYQSLRAIPGVTIYSPGDARRRTGIVSFNVGDLSSARVAQTLGDREICVRGGLHCAPEAHRFLGTLSRGCVRASIGAFNTAEDVETLVRAVAEIARNG